MLLCSPYSSRITMAIELCDDCLAGPLSRDDLLRMPLSVWGIFMATVLGCSFPAYCQRRHMTWIASGTSFFLPRSSRWTTTHTHGGSPLLFQHLFCSSFIRRSISLPYRPSASSPTCSAPCTQHIFGYRMMVWAILAICCLSFVVWLTTVRQRHEPVFWFLLRHDHPIIAVPTAIKVYNWCSRCGR